MELVRLRFRLDSGATRRARDHWTHGEADLVVGLLYLGPVDHAMFVNVMVVTPGRHLGVQSSRFAVADHVSLLGPLLSDAIVILKRFRHVQRVALALVTDQSVAGYEVFGLSEQAVLGSHEVVGRVVVEIAAETANGVAIIFRRL